MGVKDGRVADARVLVRGEIRNQGPIVKRGFLQVLDRMKAYPIGSGKRTHATRLVADPAG